MTGALDSLNSNLDSLLTVRTVQKFDNLPANGVLKYTINATLEGYTALGVVGFDTSYPNTLEVHEIGIPMSGTEVTGLVSNPNNQALNSALIANVLYVKNIK